MTKAVRPARVAGGEWGLRDRMCRGGNRPVGSPAGVKTHGKAAYGPGEGEK